MSRIEIDIERCKACELCISVCPNKIIKLSENYNSKGSHYAICINIDKCTGCSLCAIICPDVAIKVYKNSKNK